jgi:hypothetical protein
MRMHTKAALLGAVLALATLSLALGAPAGEPQRDTRSPTFDDLIPQWELGDSWVVETKTRPLQARSDTGPDTFCKAIQWQFAVARFEKTLADDCYRMEVKCLAPGAVQPSTVLWIDKKSRAVRKIETQLPVPGGFRTVTYNYQFSSGQPSPVLGPLSALPIDLPLFTGGEAKGMQTFAYQMHTGPEEAKELGQLGFAYHVEQRVDPSPSEHVKGLLNETFAKSLTAQPVVEVRLKSGRRQVRQLWQPGLPWPAYSNNGSTECRLVKVIPADAQAQE